MELKKVWESRKVLERTRAKFESQGGSAIIKLDDRSVYPCRSPNWSFFELGAR